MSNTLYYFTIDLVVEEHKLTDPIEIAEKVYEEFEEDFSPQQVANYLKKEHKTTSGLTLKDIFHE